MDVDLNLYLKGVAQNFAKAHFSDVGDFEELLRYVYNRVSEKYASSASIQKNTHGIYELDGTTIPEGIALPEPRSGNPSIDIFFEQSKERTSDTTDFVGQIDKLFEACNKHYRPIGSKISEKSCSNTTG